MAITLPVPPTGNLMFRTIKIRGQLRHVRSAAWKKWLKAAKASMEAAITSGHLPSLDRTISAVTITAVINHRRDLDNVAKPVLDALTAAGVIQDDRWINRLHMTRSHPGIRGLPADTIAVDVVPFFGGCEDCPGDPYKTCKKCGKYMARDRR